MTPDSIRSLVVLAAGMGSRFGGLKQLAAVGPGGATLMEYSIYDAIRAGFGRAVFVIRPDMTSHFLDWAGERFAGAIEVRTAVQRLEDVPRGVTVPPGRRKPWGTAHAVLAARAEITGTFAVLNADDFYGREALELVATFLARVAPTEARALLPGYPLRDTVSEAGPVNRAVLRPGSHGALRDLEEIYDIRQENADTYAGLGRGGPVTLPGSALVSMNLWGLTPMVLPFLDAGFRAFLSQTPGTDGEFLLPDLIRHLLEAGSLRVDMAAPRGHWWGLTHAADRPAVERAMADLVAAGEYPERLWG